MSRAENGKGRPRQGDPIPSNTQNLNPENTPDHRQKPVDAPVNVWASTWETVGVRRRVSWTLFVTCPFCGGHGHRHVAQPGFVVGKRKASCGQGTYTVHACTVAGGVAA